MDPREFPADCGGVIMSSVTAMDELLNAPTIDVPAAVIGGNNFRYMTSVGMEMFEEVKLPAQRFFTAGGSVNDNLLAM